MQLIQLIGMIDHDILLVSNVSLSIWPHFPIYIVYNVSKYVIPSHQLRVHAGEWQIKWKKGGSASGRQMVSRSNGSKMFCS